MACQCCPTRGLLHDRVLPRGCCSLCPLCGLPTVPARHCHCCTEQASWHRRPWLWSRWSVGWAAETRRRRSGARRRRLPSQARCQDTYHIWFIDIFHRSWIIYDFEIYQAVNHIKTYCILHETRGGGGGLPRMVLKLWFHKFFYEIIYDFIPLVLKSHMICFFGGGTKNGFETMKSQVKVWNQIWFHTLWYDILYDSIGLGGGGRGGGKI